MAMQLLAAVASLLLLLWPARRAGAAEYVVGDVEYGWDSGNGINYPVWASKHAFAVGDVLGQLSPPALLILAHDREFHTDRSRDPCDRSAACVQFSST